MAYEQEIKDQARALRRDGMTMPEIARRLGVARSTVSLWTRDLPRPPVTCDPAGADARLAALRRYFAESRVRAAARRAEEVAHAASAVGELSEREILLAGTVAYWAEGSKSKPWRASDRVVFTNSDPGLILLFRAYLRLLGVTDDRLRFRVSIHESADVAAAQQHWAGLVGVPVSQFQRPTLKRHRVNPGRYNIGAAYNGCLVMSVLRSAPLYRQIEGMWGAIVSTAASNLGAQSRVV